MNVEKNNKPDHICKEGKYCICHALADEPNENCPVHGTISNVKRCIICGKFMKKNDNQNSKS